MYSWLTVGAVAALAIIYVGRPRPAPPQAFDDDTGFQARGQLTAVATPILRVYQLTDGASRPLGARMGATQELGFAYENPGGFSHLLVVGVDEASRLFWYFPDPDRDDRAVGIAAGAGLHELPEGIRHRYHAGRLRILGIFSRTPLSAAAIARGIAPTGCAALAGQLGDSACTEIDVDVDVGEETRP